MKLKLKGCNSKMGLENSAEDSILAFGWIERVQEEGSRVVHSRIPATEASRHSEQPLNQVHC